MGIILDSSSTIAAERRAQTAQQFLTEVAGTAGNQRAALSSIGLTELVRGVYRSPNLPLRMRRQQFLDELLAALPVVPYDEGTALLAGKIDAEQKNQGITIPFSDLLIGATALSLGYSVLTVNLRHFKLIPGLHVIEFK